MDLSIIIPVYNEEKNIRLLYKEIVESLERLQKSYEILFIDDGSTDNSGDIIDELAKTKSNVRPVHLMRNFGQTAAFSAGIEFSKGKVIITMDGDLQNDPADIPRILAKLGQYDVVSGWRYVRKDNIGKRLPSLLSNWLAKKLTGVNIHDSGCSLKAYKASMLKGLQIYGEMHRFIPALCSFKGAKVGEVRVNHRARRYGKTKYGIRRLINGFLDLMYVTFWGSYSTKPLHFLGLLGIIQYLFSGIILIEQMIKAFFFKRLTLGPLLLLAVLFLITGTLFIIFGFILEIMIRTYYMNSEQKPYTLRE